MIKKGNKQSTLPKILLILGGIFMALLSLEIGIRLISPPKNSLGFDDYGNMFICSTTLGWQGRPNYQTLYETGEFSTPLQFNAIGMHDTEHTYERPANTFRILWIGDSYAQAMQVAESQTAHQQLEDMLNERLGSSERHFEVISTAIAGWGTGQQLNYYREQGRLYDADLVLLLLFIGNDFMDNLPGHAFTINRFNCFSPYFPVCEDGNISSVAWPHVPGLAPAWGACSGWSVASGLSFIQYNSALFGQLEPLLIKWKPRRVFSRSTGFSFIPLYLPEESDELQYAWQVIEGLLGQFNREVTDDRAKFAVTLISPAQVVELAQMPPAQQDYFLVSEPQFREVAIDRPNHRLTEFLQNQHVPVIDLQQPMIDYGVETEAQLYLPADKHWTIEGNRVAAEIILNSLIEQDMLH